MNRTLIDLVIFDCDGVLVDTEPLANQVFVELMRENGFDVNEMEYLHKFAGVTLPDRIRTIAQELNWTPPENLLSLFHERLIALTEKKIQPIPGIREFVQSLPAPVCVASNGSRNEINLRLKLSNLASFFGNAIFSGLEVPNPKPAPDVYLAAARAFNAMPSRCMVVEDSLPGVTAGVRAGMSVYGYAALIPEEKLREAGAIPFKTMNELTHLTQFMLFSQASKAN
ncbi:MAG: HAD family phosphatase [Chloroflexi bacterium]|nr:HAD family phosphatase [Chloroflexota bacterium]